MAISSKALSTIQNAPTPLLTGEARRLVTKHDLAQKLAEKVNPAFYTDGFDVSNRVQARDFLVSAGDDGVNVSFEAFKRPDELGYQGLSPIRVSILLKDAAADAFAASVEAALSALAKPTVVLSKLPKESQY